MKEFKKQYAKDDCNLNVDCGDLSCKECKKIQAASWWRALKWVLTHKADIISTKFIEKELEDENKKT